ncbi:MAG: ABC transporter substrate-binding protein, partial [Alphaproteobacteria bacterium]
MAGAFGGAIATRAGTARAQARSTTLRFIPQADLSSLDPIVTTSYAVRNYGYLVFDTLYAADAGFRARPQMVEGHDVSADGLTWTMRLREGLRFHDGSPVRAVDCVA